VSAAIVSFRALLAARLDRRPIRVKPSFPGSNLGIAAK
jgi:hypothetical protein